MRGRGSREAGGGDCEREGKGEGRRRRGGCGGKRAGGRGGGGSGEEEPAATMRDAVRKITALFDLGEF